MRNLKPFQNKKEWGGVILNPNCINNCLFCEPPRNIDEIHIRKQEINVARNLRELKKKGIKWVEISGSDPIEYKKLIPLIRYMKEEGFERIQLSTHGRQLSNKNFRNELIKAGLDKVRIPLYGSNAKVHDSVTCTKGSFEDALAAIKGLLKNSSIHMSISCLIMQQNKEDLIALVNLLNNLGVKDFYFSIPCVSDNDYSYYIPMKELTFHARQVYNHCKKIGFRVRFMEIPYCVFGRVDDSINNLVSPPDLGKHCQPPEKYKTKIKDLPSYRMKTKTKICEKCKCSGFCDGFFINDVKKFGTGRLKALE